MRGILEGSPAAGELAVPAGNPFAAKSMIRDLVATASSDLLVVDTYIGLGTLDCFREVAVPIRLLTSKLEASIEKDLDRHLLAFRAEGRKIEVRRIAGLHDRHLVFNDRAHAGTTWLDVST